MTTGLAIDSEPMFDQEVTHAEGVVLVDFWAEWCGPCKTMTPLVADLGVRYAGKLKVCMVNVDTCQGLAQRFGIRGIPALVLFKGGEVLSTRVGLQNKAQLTAFIESAIS